MFGAGKFGSAGIRALIVVSRGTAGQDCGCAVRGPVPRLGGAVVVGQAEVVAFEVVEPADDDDGKGFGGNVGDGIADDGMLEVGVLEEGNVPSDEPGNPDPLVDPEAGVTVLLLFIGKPLVDIGCVAAEDDAVVGTGVGIGDVVGGPA